MKNNLFTFLYTIKPGLLSIDTDTNDGDSLFGGEYTYNGNDKKSITVVIDYVYRKRVAKADVINIKNNKKRYISCQRNQKKT